MAILRLLAIVCYCYFLQAIHRAIGDKVQEWVLLQRIFRHRYDDIRIFDDLATDCLFLLESLLREAIYVRNEKPSATISARSWLERLDELLKKNLDHLRKEFNELKRGLIKCRDYIFYFLENPAIPSDNNASERGIRKLKVKQKMSGCFRSDTGADAFHAIHSIADTACKNNQSPLDAILALV